MLYGFGCWSVLGDQAEVQRFYRLKGKKQLPKTKTANLEAHMRMVGALTFIQARAERLGNRCQSSMMEKSNGSEEAIAANWNSEDGFCSPLEF